MKFYEVGGHVRDSLLGIKSKDVDYSVDMTGINLMFTDDLKEDPNYVANAYYEHMNRELTAMGFEIFLESPACFTTRAKFPKNHKHQGVADFVMCRKEIGYIPGTRQPIVELGNLYDDLERRDFTVNAIAKCIETDEIIDPFNGQLDLINNLLRCPINAQTSFNDDPLRLIRALRFNVTKGFVFDEDIVNTLVKFESAKLIVVSTERIREELYKMFHYSTLATLENISWLRGRNFELYKVLFEKIWLKPTLEDK